MDKKEKRERSANFNNSETRVLVETVLEYANVIENKETDATNNKQKAIAWEEIAKKINASNGTVFRTAKTIKLKYESLKKNLRKKAADQKRNMYLTGGGPPVEMKFTDYEDKLLGVIKLNVEGLPARSDCDSYKSNAHSMVNEIYDLSNIIEINTVNLHADSNTDDFDNTMAVVTLSEPIIIDNDLLHAPKEHVTDNNHNIVEERSIDNIPQSTPNKTPPLINKWTKRRSNINSGKLLYKNKVTNDTTINKFDELASAKQELVQLQIDEMKRDNTKKGEHLEKEIEFKEKEYELRLKILQAELEEKESLIRRNNSEHHLRMKILEKQLKEN